MHSAVLNEDIPLVQGLIKLGCDIGSGATIDFEDRTCMDVTALHIAIFKKNPQIVALMLQADDINTAMAIKCTEKNTISLSPLQLAVKRAKEAKDTNSTLVCIVHMVYVFILISRGFKISLRI